MSDDVFPVNLTEGEMVDILNALEKRAEVVSHVFVAHRLRRLHDRLERVFEQRDDLDDMDGDDYADRAEWKSRDK
jgi:hypothetical protein